MAVSKKDILDTISNMTVVEIVDLVEAMEEKFNVSAAAPVAVAAAPAAGGDVAEVEKDEFDVVMTSFGGNKVPVIKAVRSITSLGLKEAKELVETANSIIKEGVSKSEAEEIKKQLEEVGASIELR